MNSQIKNLFVFQQKYTKNARELLAYRGKHHVPQSKINYNCCELDCQSYIPLKKCMDNNHPKNRAFSMFTYFLSCFNT